MSEYDRPEVQAKIKEAVQSGLLDVGPRRTCESKARLDGKVVVITGANTGIGKETALQLSQRGAKVYIGCRDVAKAEKAIEDIKKANPKADIIALKLDLASFKSIREFAKQLKAKEPVIDILINNAGVMNCPEWKTEDGFEMQFGTNHLGHFLLTMHLLPHLKKSSGKARVVNVTGGIYAITGMHLDNPNLTGIYKPLLAYAHSKLANILFTREMAKRLGKNSNVNCYVLHPGVIETELTRHDPIGRDEDSPARALLISVELGAQTTVYCAVDESLENETGHYYDNCKRLDKLTKEATDDETARKLWDLSCEWVQLEDEYKI